MTQADQLRQELNSVRSDGNFGGELLGRGTPSLDGRPTQIMPTGKQERKKLNKQISGETPKFKQEFKKLIKNINDPSASMYSKGLTSYMREQLLARGKLALESGEIEIGLSGGSKNDRIIQAMFDSEQQKQ